MIRPRPGPFTADKQLLDQIREDIRIAAGEGADGVVFGILNSSGAIDRDANYKLISLCRQLGLSTTFHRAIDAVIERRIALRQILDLGFDRVLSNGTRWGSGGAALDGIDTLKQTLSETRGKIELVIGGGVTAINRPRIDEQLGPNRRRCQLAYLQ